MTVSNPTIEKLIPNWVDLYTEALEDNFRHYKVNMLTNNSARYTGSREDLSAYAEEQLEAIRNGTDKLMKFEAVAGKNTIKLCNVSGLILTKSIDRDQSIVLLTRKQAKFIRHHHGRHPLRSQI
ncbi:MAG: hypothetical protein CM15mV6_0090 [uncultured marine virus]|nr:MAG: hypothetical protein CM15mV6_0090 [uncultured marine virus]